MNNKLLLAVFFSSASVLLMAFSFFYQGNNVRFEASAQIPSPYFTPPPRTPTPACGTLQTFNFREECGTASYRYIDYVCGNSRGILGSPSSCKTARTWWEYATSECQTRLGCRVTPTVSRPTPTTSRPTPTVSTRPLSKHVYITYTCRNDLRGGSYVLTNNTACRTSAEWINDANYSCSQKTGGACGPLSNCVETYTFSPACAVGRALTVTPFRTATPTRSFPTRTPTPAPSRYPTCNPTAPQLYCPAPPSNCRWIGGDGCTTCGRIVCTPTTSGTPTPTITY